jgi:hypothetical protein
MCANIFMFFLRKKIFYIVNGAKKQIKDGFIELNFFIIKMEKENKSRAGG